MIIIIVPPINNFTFMSLHHICLLTLLAPRLNCMEDSCKDSVLFCKLSKFSPLSITLWILSCIIPTTSFTSPCNCFVLEFFGGLAEDMFYVSRRKLKKYSSNLLIYPMIMNHRCLYPLY
eukprot:NODE_418_length_7796_cov_0.461868.p9 type:complete len:119 gc:universal NODE_418_length_7796_cov_0.461868:5304-5660(+)